MNTLSPLITVHNKGYINVDTKQTMSLIPVKMIEVETNNPHLPLIPVMKDESRIHNVQS